MSDIYRVAGIIIKDKKLLFARATGEDSFFGPGGRIEDGETPEQAMVRELKEELSIDVSPEDLEFFGDYSAATDTHRGKTTRTKAFVVKKWSSDPVPSAEVEELKWLTSELPDNIRVGSTFGGEVLPALNKLGLVD